MSLRTVFLTLLLTSSIAACAQQGNEVDPDTEAEEVFTIDGKSDLPITQPSGDYVNLAAQPGELVTLTLDADGTFERAFFVECVTFPCFPITQTGTYQLSRSTWTGATYIRFYDEAGYAGRYQYLWESASDSLLLRAAGTPDWFAMFKHQPADECPAGSSLVNCWGGPICLPDGNVCAL